MDPIQPPSQESLQPQVNTSDFQPKPNYLKTIIFSILMIFTVGLITYLFFQNQKLQKQVLNPQLSPTIQVPSPTSKKTSSISIPSDETAGWKIYTNSDFDFLIKYPSVWKDVTNPNVIKNGNKEFTIKTNKNEFVTGTVFDGPADTINDQAWSKNIELGNNRRLLITYVDNLGPGSKGGSIDIEIFDQILLTFKFIDNQSICVPTYQVETNTSELTAKQNYSLRCTEQRFEKDCLFVDLYNLRADDFSVPDGIPDCLWKNSY